MPLENFLKNIFVSPPVPLGLDIGNFSVKIVQIKTSRFSKNRLLSFALAPIKDNKSPDNVIEAIRQAHKDLATDSTSVNTSICGPNIIIRYIILPSMRRGDLYKSLEFELEKYIPYKREDTVIDCRILARLPDNKIIVLLIGVERRLIEARVSLVRSAGLEPQSINVDTLALSESFGALFSSRPKGVVALLDIGYKMTKLVVMQDGIPYFSREIETGEHNIIQIVSEKMGLDLDKARDLVHNPADKTNEVFAVVRPELYSMLLDDLLLSLEYCERDLEKKVELMYLTGGGSRNKILLECLGKIPDLKIGPLDTLQNFKISSSKTEKELEESAPLLAVAIGLASGGTL
jgi:type IV pilus assembly protein PilM